MTVYLYKLEEDYRCYFPVNIRFKNKWCVIADNVITIKKGYAWNGCSPNQNIFDLGYIGTPNGTLDTATGKPKLYYASCVHDCLYQFKGAMEVTRKQADDLMLSHMKDQEFSLSYLYYVVIRALGWVFGSWRYSVY